MKLITLGMAATLLGLTAGGMALAPSLCLALVVMGIAASDRWFPPTKGGTA